MAVCGHMYVFIIIIIIITATTTTTITTTTTTNTLESVGLLTLWFLGSVEGRGIKEGILYPSTRHDPQISVRHWSHMGHSDHGCSCIGDKILCSLQWNFFALWCITNVSEFGYERV